MPVSSPFQIKTLEKAEVGELVCVVLGSGEPTWGIIVFKTNDGRASLAALRSGLVELNCPTLTSFVGHQECMSFGTAWIFEVVVDASTHDFGDTQRHRTNAGWFVRGDAVALRLGPNDNEGMSGAFVDLEKFRAVSATSGDGVYGTRWRLWKSAEEQVRLGGKPLLESEPVAAVSP